MSTLSTGRIIWRPNEVDLALVRAASPEQSLTQLERALPLVVWNAAALEGNSCTAAEVEALVGGGRIEKPRFEIDQVLALRASYLLMIAAVRDGSFTLSKQMSDRIHGVVAKHEAIESGSFRGEGRVFGGGSVRLASGGIVEGDLAGEGGRQLQEDFTNLLAELATLSDARARALAYFASVTRSQYYFDGNKRTARIMMTGALIQSGFEPINVPYTRQEEFNGALDELFRTDDGTRLIRFLTTCTMIDSR